MSCHIDKNSRTYECNEWVILKEMRDLFKLRFKVVDPDVFDAGAGVHFFFEVAKNELVLLIVAFEHDLASGLQRELLLRLVLLLAGHKLSSLVLPALLVAGASG